MSEPETSVPVPPWRDFTEGTKVPGGQTIADIVSRSDKCIVYVDTEGSLGWLFDDKACIDGDDTVARAAVLLHQARQSLQTPKMHRAAVSAVAQALVLALDSRRASDPRDFFASAREFIAARRYEVLQFYYLSWATVALVVLAPLLWWIGRNGGFDLRDFTFASVFGAFGAMISVIQRFKSLPFGPHTSRANVSVAGFVRVAFGAAFGAVFLLFQKSELLLGALEGNSYATALFTLVAGFSERIVPELLLGQETKLAAAGTSAEDPEE